MEHVLHKSIGALIVRAINGFGKGTGMLISPNLVLTAAHNLYNSTTGEEHTDFKFYPGQNGTLTKYY